MVKFFFLGKGIKMALSGGKVIGTILGNIY